MPPALPQSLLSLLRVRLEWVKMRSRKERSRSSLPVPLATLMCRQGTGDKPPQGAPIVGATRCRCSVWCPNIMSSCHHRYFVFPFSLPPTVHCGQSHNPVLVILFPGHPASRLSLRARQQLRCAPAASASWVGTHMTVGVGAVWLLGIGGSGGIEVVPAAVCRSGEARRPLVPPCCCGVGFTEAGAAREG